MENSLRFLVLLSEETSIEILFYKNDIVNDKVVPGVYLKEEISKVGNVCLSEMSTEQFLQCLLFTKKPLIFAESEVKGDGSYWNYVELHILGDLSVSMDVDIHDNGVWSPMDSNFCVHEPPMQGMLLFMPGPLLECGMPDFIETTTENSIDQAKYNLLIERRLTPLLYIANENAMEINKRALITIPGVGCGAFAGEFRGKMGQHLNESLRYILAKHARNLDRIACIYYDPFGECKNQEDKMDNVVYRVRPAMDNNFKSQLCDPKDYQEPGDDFSDCKLFKVVAWDHVSFPGNDYFGDSRNTDDGVSAAATNSMEIITGIRGRYEHGNYLPPEGNRYWLQVAKDNSVTLRVKSNIKCLKTDGSFVIVN